MTPSGAVAKAKLDTRPPEARCVLEWFLDKRKLPEQSKLGLPGNPRGRACLVPENHARDANLINDKIDAAQSGTEKVARRALSVAVLQRRWSR